jgi:hypothetical protein
MDDVHAAIIENPGLEVLTESGGQWRKANTTGATDALRMNQQRSVFPVFLGTDRNPKQG